MKGEQKWQKIPTVNPSRQGWEVNKKALACWTEKCFILLSP